MMLLGSLESSDKFEDFRFGCVLCCCFLHLTILQPSDSAAIIIAFCVSPAVFCLYFPMIPCKGLLQLGLLYVDLAYTKMHTDAMTSRDFGGRS